MFRCDALNFHMSKSHKKIVKKFNKFVKTGEFNKNVIASDNNQDMLSQNEELFMAKPPPKFCLNDLQNCIENDRIPSTSATETKTVKSTNAILADVSVDSLKEHHQVEKREKSPIKKGLGADLSKVPCKKARFLRLERKQKKLAAKGINLDQQKIINQVKDLEGLFNEISDDSLHKFQVFQLKWPLQF